MGWSKEEKSRKQSKLYKKMNKNDKPFIKSQFSFMNLSKGISQDKF